MNIRILDKTEEIPYTLLLLADETKEAINKYIFDSDIYIAEVSGEKVGVFCLQEIDSVTIELKNIAIAEKFQSLGYGSLLLDYIKTLVKDKYRNLIVGTGDAGWRQIRFYEKNGFKKYDVRKNFFVENYKDPIIENGTQLIDMVLLKYEF